MCCESPFGHVFAALHLMIEVQPLPGVIVDYFAVRPEVDLCRVEEEEIEKTHVVSTVENDINHSYQPPFTFLASLTA